MIRKLIFAAAFAAVALSATTPASAASEQNHPRLKPDAVVTGDLVRIGDLVANAGIVADVPIFRAPDLGATGIVSAQAVIQAVRAHALIGLDTGDVREVVVTRPARTIAAKEVEGRVIEALASQYALGQPKDIMLRFDAALDPIRVEPTAKGAPRVTRISYDRDSGRFDAVVAIPSRPPLRLSGHAIQMTEVVTVAEPIARGDVVKQADVVIERRPRRNVPADALGDVTRVVGLAARNNLPAGHVLRTADLTAPELVRRNETVTLIYRVPGISLTVRGRAMEGGAEGDIIGVLNEQTKRTVHGAVIGPGQVMIAAASPRLAVNSFGTGAVYSPAH